MKEFFCVQEDAFEQLYKGCDKERLQYDPENKITIRVTPQNSSKVGANMVNLYYHVKSKYPSSRLPEVMNKLVCSYYGIYFNMDRKYQQIIEDSYCFKDKLEFSLFGAASNGLVLSCTAKSIEGCRGEALVYDSKPLCN
jgi:hypothetical protein